MAPQGPIVMRIEPSHSKTVDGSSGVNVELTGAEVAWVNHAKHLENSTTSNFLDTMDCELDM